MPAVHPKGHPAMLPGGLFDSLHAQKDEVEKLLDGDGVEIVVFTISAWALFFVVYILGRVFRLW
jgi:hypothetical protein